MNTQSSYLLSAVGLAGVIALTASACAPTPSSPIRTPEFVQLGGEAPQLRLVDHLRWPYQVDRLIVAIDGAPVAAFPNETGVVAASVPSKPLSPGEHVISVMVNASVSGSECNVEINRSQSFSTLQGTHPNVDIELTSDGLGEAFEKRLDVRMLMSGAVPSGAGAGDQVRASAACRDSWRDAFPDPVKLPNVPPVRQASF